MWEDVEEICWQFKEQKWDPQVGHDGVCLEMVLKQCEQYWLSGVFGLKGWAE